MKQEQVCPPGRLNKYPSRFPQQVPVEEKGLQSSEPPIIVRDYLNTKAVKSPRIDPAPGPYGYLNRMPPKLQGLSQAPQKTVTVAGPASQGGFDNVKNWITVFRFNGFPLSELSRKANAR